MDRPDSSPTPAYVATCPKGVEWLLAEELRALGVPDVRESRAAVTFTGALAVAYRACLWSRLASRVLLVLAEFPASTAEQLYDGVVAVPWEEHVDPRRTIAVDANGTTSGLTHTGFAARKVKDALVDRIRDTTGSRPSVDLDAPDVRLNLRLRRETATLSLDLSGDPLHRRGYRAPGEQGEAPLKENLAAAILVRAGWPEIGAGGGSLFDPMCGSGTLLVEGALMVTDRAPGLLRQRWGFAGWLGHDERVWDTLIDEADERAERGDAALPAIAGSDIDPGAVELARACLRQAGFGDRVSVDVRDIAHAAPPAHAEAGLVVTNPPYGVRVGAGADLEAVYATLGERLLSEFDGWRGAIFTAEERLARATGLRSSAAHTLYNGAIPARVYVFDITPGAARKPVERTADRSAEPADGSAEPAGGTARSSAVSASAPGAEMFANRLRKNAKHVGKWARRQGITCYRVYDADLPDYALAVDLYRGAGPDESRLLAHVQEYAPPSSVDPELAERRLESAVALTAEVLGVAHQDVAVKVRRRQRGTSQYERQATRGEFVQVQEAGLRLYVNLHDYLDTGLFLDHRITRSRVRELAHGARFLNLFAYTGTASVHAAAGGATHTTTVDMSATYLDWARRNMVLNGYEEGDAHRFVRADVLGWLAEETWRPQTAKRGPFDLVFLDPPSFSNSKRMGGRTFDVQRDHVELIRETVELLAEGGTLVFSTNLRRFELDAQAFSELDVADITAETIPKDFERTPRIHSCYVIRRGPSRT